MTLEAQIGLITVPQEFSRLCNAVLQADHADDLSRSTTTAPMAATTAT